MGRKAKAILLRYDCEIPEQIQAKLVHVKNMLVQEGIIDNDSIDLNTPGVLAQENALKMYHAVMNSIGCNPFKFLNLVGVIKTFTTLKTVAEELKKAGN